ncbi:MAG: DUF924 family protein [Cyanobacteria bacterium P01_E01_bin.48]
MKEVEAVLTFWFGEPTPPEYGKSRKIWFAKDTAFDRQCSDRFLALHEKLATGLAHDWKVETRSCLAAIVVLDQFSRNMFRNSARAFATDALALELANYAINRGFDLELLTVERWFMYLPFEHSENLSDQDRAVELFQQLAGDPDSDRTLDYAIRHRDVIRRFGRFPHRNTMLGRETTPEEARFLQQPGSQF